MVTRVCVKCNMARAGLTKAKADELPFVCGECRCEDCGVILDYQCPTCGVVHGERSKSEPARCTNCVNFRADLQGMPVHFQDLVMTELAEEGSIFN